MKPMRFCRAFLLIASACLSLGAVQARADTELPAVARVNGNAPVTITNAGDSWILSNGMLRVTVRKNNGNIPSCVYRGVNIVGHPETWEQLPMGRISAGISIDPASNGGERGEVAVQGINGKMDIQVRYALERGLSGLYAYAQYSHEPSYPNAGFGENRLIFEMNRTFDWLSVDQDRNMLMCDDRDVDAGVVIHAKEQRILSTGIYKNSVEHKYSYCGVIYKLPAYGWSSTKDHIGIYFINPTTEYIGGGAEKLDLVCHMGACILDYWTSGHYAGGDNCNIPAGQKWTKVVGPVLVYFNTLADPQQPTASDLQTLRATEGNPTIPPALRNNALALWHDALDQAQKERAKWPYEWVNGVDYPHKDQRGTVTGQFVLDDPQAASKLLPHLTVGVAHPDYRGLGGAFAERSGNGDLVTWAHDANYYEFWTDGSDDGKFTIRNVRPGQYTLHAFADGVLGEFAQTNITVEAGQTLDLGRLEWKPVRYGKQIWEIGYPDRTADKFFKGDGANYWKWGWDVRYPLLFPNDITYTIGKSDYHKDWFFEEVPHGTSTAWLNPDAKDPANQPFGWVHVGTPGQDMWRIIGRGRATTWTIVFNMPHSVSGQATLRVALAGSDGPGFAVGVNGREVGTIRTISTNALRYNTDRGVWRQYMLQFDASLLRYGENRMQLTVPAGELTSGVVWDYLRLEVNGG